MQQFNIDISQPRGPLVLYASQGDSLSRFFSVTVTDNGAAYTPPDGAIYTVRFGAPGMPAGWYDTIEEVGGSTHPAVVVSGNTYTVELAEQAVSVPGTNAVVVIVSDATGYALATWAFELQVAAVPGYDAPEATVYYNALSEQVAQTLANAQAAAASATLSESWAVGGTGTRPGEDTNNAAYWASEAQRVSQGALGWYETEQALQAAHPTGTNGQWAIIGSTDTIWTWDSDTSAWVDSGAQVDLSNYYTKAQSDARYATAAQGTKADTAVQSVNGKTGAAVTLNPQDVGGLSTYTCSTSGTIHALTGAGNNIKFVADAAFEAGDTIMVNGQAVTAQTQDGVALAAGAWASGAVVVCYLEGSTLNFKGGGGKVTVSGLTAGDIFTGHTVKIYQGATEVLSVDGDLDVLAASLHVDGVSNYKMMYWNGTEYVNGAPGATTVTITGTPKIVSILYNSDSSGTICGHSDPGTYLTDHTNIVRGIKKHVCFVVLGIK